MIGNKMAILAIDSIRTKRICRESNLSAVASKPHAQPQRHWQLPTTEILILLYSVILNNKRLAHARLYYIDPNTSSYVIIF